MRMFMKTLMRIAIFLLIIIIISLFPIIFGSVLYEAVSWTMLVLPFLFVVFLIVAIGLMLRMYKSK